MKCGRESFDSFDLRVLPARPRSGRGAEQSGRISEKAPRGRGRLVSSGSGEGEESSVAGGDGMGMWLSPAG